MIALNSTAVAWVIFAIVTIGWLTYFFLNKGSARAELGSQAELAPNPKAYYDDEPLEGPRLQRLQLLGGLRTVHPATGFPPS